ncbi:L-fuconolactonase [Mucilaginibacter mallensis]|uniref:L-fuconolactonase n=1 Tax=Mucilaginibacter mallensis TaxID=652787 RepID=A0A1H1WNB7_MUCMA|nr:amidohydrolase family protein [Mucilaginibacter mallensis]SDS98512.1 L-fuconolactonase [Mucilaginibacter mallensis]
MARIDSHQHFWKYDPVKYDWIDDSMPGIRRDFLPHDLEPVLKANGFDGCITVQSHQSEQENDFQLANADRYNFIKGVVGWVDLQSPNIEARLAHYKQFKKMKGFRHVLQGEPQRDLMLQPAFLHGISLLKKYNYTYDILIFPDQLKYIAKFVAQFPDQLFVIDHIAKPNIKQAEIVEWEKDIKSVAQFENVFCKVSGMVTEADWQNWKPADFNPYLDVIADNFGRDRIMFGSDWPVCKIAAEYEQVAGIVAAYFSAFSQTEQENIFGANAARFYNI